MKRILLATILCAISSALGQNTQSISFTGPTLWAPGTTVSLNVFLTFSGYSSYGLSYWLEVPNVLGPFISITNVQYFTFPDANQLTPNPAPFNTGPSGGASTGYMLETRDLGATVDIVDPQHAVPPGTYQIATITFRLTDFAPNGLFTMFTTSHTPRISAVADTTFSDHNIIPPGSFVFAIGIPEPSTIALLSFTVLGWGVFVFRRRNR